jgi:hypothetical protein
MHKRRSYVHADFLVSECLAKLGEKKPSQTILHEMMKLAACEGTVQFDLTTFCRIYVEYMCAAVVNCICNTLTWASTKLCHLKFCAATLNGRNENVSKVNMKTGASA